MTAKEIHRLYTADETAPVGWHLKNQLRKNLRGRVRRLLKLIGLPKKAWAKDIPNEIDEYAVQNFVKYAPISNISTNV